MAPRLRIYLDQPLAAGQCVRLTPEQAHYLITVMRAADGSEVHVFNGISGEWQAELERQGRRGGTLRIARQSAPQVDPPDLWLLFAPVKKTRTDSIVEKAVELGVARIIPVQTHHTNSERIRQDRLQAHAIEAAEQCGSTFVPLVKPLNQLSRVLSQWEAGRALMFCDEAATRDPTAALGEALKAPAAILIGPEGGFSPDERALLRALPGVVRTSLGPRILRADTAVAAAITYWQVFHGDWR